MKNIKLLLKKYFTKISSYLLKYPSTLPDPDKIKKIMVWSQPGIGNLILFLPAFKLLRKSFPDSKITLIHPYPQKSYMVYQHCPYFDDLIIVKTRSEKIGFLLTLRKKKFDLTLNNFLNQDLFSMMGTILSGALYRLGHISSDDWKGQWDKIFSIQAQMRREQHEIERYFVLIHGLGIDIKDAERRPLIKISDTDLEYGEGLLKENGININVPCIAIQVDVNPHQKWKQWGIDKIIQLCERMTQELAIPIILLGSQLSEYDLISLENLKGPVINLVAKTTIQQAAAILKTCSLAITNDSGLMHLASAVGTDTIALFGPTDLIRTGPYGKNNIIVTRSLPCQPCYHMDEPEKLGKACQHKYTCMKEIEPDEIFHLIKSHLNNGDK